MLEDLGRRHADDGVVLEHSEQQLLRLRGQREEPLALHAWRLGDRDLRVVEPLDLGVAVRHAPGEHREEEHPEAPYVHRRAVRDLVAALGGEEARRAHGAPHGGRGVESGRHPHVDQLERELVVRALRGGLHKQDVLRLEVSVQEALLVHEVHGPGYLHKELCSLLLAVELDRLEVLEQLPPLQALQHHHELRLVLVGLLEGDDIRVL
mmetsp:Transcript_17699/g.42444  ORF Transcript_17699/g.42444 Transcript_17699/m.42444 type:complete len:208 (-) Transcript_17699:883-1506(-)